VLDAAASHRECTQPGYDFIRRKLILEEKEKTEKEFRIHRRRIQHDEQKTNSTTNSATNSATNSQDDEFTRLNFNNDQYEFPNDPETRNNIVQKLLYPRTIPQHARSSLATASSAASPCQPLNHLSHLKP
jgi:hypothetical protein